MRRVFKKPTNLKGEGKEMGSMRPHRGHTLFKVNTETLEISKVEFSKESVVHNKKGPVGLRKGSHKIVQIEEGFVYFSALNEKNVIKKMKQQVGAEAVDAMLAKKSA